MLLVIKLVIFISVPVIIFGVSAKQESKNKKSNVENKPIISDMKQTNVLPDDFTISDLISNSGGSKHD